MIIKELPVFERPVERLQKLGKEELSNSELLAIIIGSGTSERSAKILAEDVLSLDESGLLFLQECTVEELSVLKGIGRFKAAKIVAALELGKRLATVPRSDRTYIGSTEDVASIFMEKMRYYKKETFICMMLDTKGGILGVETVTVGDVSSSIVHPREAFRSAIKKSAFAVVFVHNHPSGDPTPSDADIRVTKRLCEGGELLGIKLLDHVIIGDGRYTSFKELGYI